jgi:putative peptide maturation system protein
VSSPGDFVALRVAGQETSLRDLFAAAKFIGKLDFIEHVVRAALVRTAAAQQAIEVSDDELQHEADAFRTERGLYDVKSTENWLAARRLEQEDWEAQLEDQVLARKLRERVSQGRIEQYFAENKRSFDAATIARILVADEGLARELRAAIVEDNASFYDLAQRFSIDQATKAAGGRLGTLRRAGLHPALEAAVFGARPGEVAGPVRTEEGWHLVRVEEVHPATLDGGTRETITALLFEEWLADRRAKTEIHLPVLSDL